MGLELLRRKDLGLRGRLGLGVQREFDLADPEEDEEWTPEAVVGFEMHWQINDRQRLELWNTVKFDLDQAGEYLNNTRASWVVKLNEPGSLNLKTGIENEYDTTRTNPFQRNEITYFVALLFEF